MRFVYRRTITNRAGTLEYVVYAVESSDDGSNLDRIPVVAGFPAGWRPTHHPGQCLAELGAEAAIIETSCRSGTMSESAKLARCWRIAGCLTERW